MLIRVTSIAPHPKEALRQSAPRIIVQKDKFHRHKVNNKTSNSPIQRGIYLEIAKVQRGSPPQQQSIIKRECQLKKWMWRLRDSARKSRFN